MPHDANVPPFIVDRILPHNVIHLLFGPISEENTTLLLQIAQDWSRGDDVFGHRSYPAPFMFVACEQAIEPLERDLVRVGLDPDVVPHISLVGRTRGEDRNVESALLLARQRRSEVRVLFLDGIYSLCRGHINDYCQTSNFLNDVGALCAKEGITILASATSAKSKNGEGYALPRERLHGSGAWASMTHTKILLEPAYPSRPSDLRRHVTVMPRGMRLMNFSYRFAESGPYVLELTPSLVYENTLDGWLSQKDSGESMTTQEFLVLARQLGVSEATLYRWIRKHVELGNLTLAKRGVYVVGADAPARAAAAATPL